MQKFIPKVKLSKKAQRELNKESRGTWNGVNPITRKTESKMIYNRKKVQQGDDYISNVEPFSLVKCQSLTACR